MRVEPGRMRIFPGLVPEMTGSMCFVRRFVFRKAGVTIDPKHGTTMRARVCNIVWGDLFQARTHCNNELTHRINDRVEVSGFVFIEPVTVVVFL